LLLTRPTLAPPAAGRAPADESGEDIGVPVIVDSASVLAAVSPAEAVERTEIAFRRHARGEWRMPPKVYVEAPEGDFRAMPARGDGCAVLKWVTSFPRNPERGLPVVTGALLLSDAGDGQLLAVIDCAAVTSLRTGAAAAVSARALARAGASSAAVIGSGVNGAWAGRCLRAIGFAEGICCDRDAAVAERLAGELGWRAGGLDEATGCDVIVTVTPGERPVLDAADLRPGVHVAMLGADAHGKAELTPAAIAAGELFCDEWRQASGGGELAGPVSRGEVAREGVTELGAVLEGAAAGRSSERAITLFDSTGLAIQDLAIALAVREALDTGRIDAPEVPL
jgi:alanine dehydrogenase